MYGCTYLTIVHERKRRGRKAGKEWRRLRKGRAKCLALPLVQGKMQPCQVSVFHRGERCSIYQAKIASQQNRD